MLDLKIAIAQQNPVVGAISENAKDILTEWQRATDMGADLVVTGEHALSGYPLQDAVEDPDLLEKVEQELEALAIATKDGAGLLVGCPLRIKGRIYNCAVLLEGGKIAQIIQKTELPNDGVFDEKRNYSAGKPQEVVLFRGHKLGVMICEDAWHRPAAKNLAAQGAEMLIVLNGSPYYQGKLQKRINDVVQPRADETGLPLLYVNLVGSQDELVFDGASFVCHPGQQSAVVQARAFATETLLTEWKDNSDGKLRCVTRVQHPVPSAEEELYQALVLGMRDYVRKNGIKKVVLGLSGGIDSAIVAAIAVDALGAENVHLVRMPSQYTSDMSMDDAEAIRVMLGVPAANMLTIPIEGEVQYKRDQYRQLMGRDFIQGAADENLQARARGDKLMELSNDNGWLVLSTGNKSELCMGYCTLHGDMCGGYNPLKDVWKTTVFKLCEWRNNHWVDGLAGPRGAVMPERVIKRPPSAELKPGQKDEDNLPPYPILDDILKRIVEQKQSARQIKDETEHDPAVIARVYNQLNFMEYKRRLSQALGPIVTPLALTFLNRRYPVTNRHRLNLEAKG